MATALDVVSGALLVLGTGFTFVAAVGLWRMPDLYGRIHVATKPATLGVSMTMTAAILQVPFGALTTRLALAVAFQFWTIPAASHMLGRAARRAGLPPATPDIVDEFDAEADPPG